LNEKLLMKNDLITARLMYVTTTHSRRRLFATPIVIKNESSTTKQFFSNKIQYYFHLKCNILNTKKNPNVYKYLTQLL